MPVAEILEYLIPTRLMQRLMRPFVIKQITKTVGTSVYSGIFKGMSFGKVSAINEYPMLLGTYEKEIYDAITKTCNHKIDKIINVGAGEGYYAVGLAKLFPRTKILAYESNDDSKSRIKELAQENNVADRITINGHCSAEKFADAIEPKANFIIMDVEGAEIELLNETIIPKLHQSIILVEVHDFVSMVIAHRLKERFNETHVFSEIWQENRTFQDFPIEFTPFKKAFFRSAVLSILDETTESKLRWLYFVPKKISIENTNTPL